MRAYRLAVDAVLARLPAERRRRREQTAREVTRLLVEVRAALAAGASPTAGLVAGVAGMTDPPDDLRRATQVARLGQPIASVAGEVATGDPALDLLIRGLGVVESCGSGAVAAVDQALEAAAEEAVVARRLRAETAQARATALVLSLAPPVGWALIVAFNPGAVAFYGTVLGLVVLVVSGLLLLASRWWTLRLIATAAAAARRADPLLPTPERRERVPVVATLLPLGVLLAVVVGPVPALLVVGIAAAALLRPRPAPAVDGEGGAAETVELLAVALAAGLAPPAAVMRIAMLAPPLARDALESAGRRLAAAWSPEEAFAGGGLALAGDALGASERWGAPAAPTLRRLAAQLRDDRRTAAEEAARRLDVTLVFPTTLLTLPAFLLGVVPPLLWATFTQMGG